MPRRNPRSRTPLHYSRDKNKVEINGDARDVKWLAWADLGSSRFQKIIIVVATLFGLYKFNVLTMIWEWISHL